MPKTLAALPSNQYATLLSLVLGKLLVRPLLFAATSPFVAPVTALLRRGRVDLHRTACRADGRHCDMR